MTGKDRTEDFLIELSRHLKVDKCRACECLLGALVQVKADRPKLAEEVDRLTAEGDVHACLGCDPCLPARAWEKYLKEKDRTD